MVHQDAHGLIKLAILIWLVNLHVMPSRLPPYLLTYHPPTYYLPTTYQLIIYLHCVFLNLDSYSLHASFF